MPICKDEWEAGRIWETFEGRILSFLRENRDKAYNITGIVNGLGYRTEMRDFWGFMSSGEDFLVG